MRAHASAPMRQSPRWVAAMPQALEHYRSGFLPASFCRHLRSLVRFFLRNDVLASAVLMAPFVGLFMGDALLPGRVFLPGDIIYRDALWQALAPAGFPGVANNLLSDQIYLYYPWRVFAGRALQQYGELPLWNPFIFGGQPFVANAQSALFYPLHWIAFFMPAGSFFGFAGVLRLYLAALFTILFMRSCGASRPAAMVAGLTYAFCGPMVVWLSYPLVDVFLWLPGVLWAAEKALSARRPARWLAIAALLIGVQGLAGHFQSYFHALAAAGLYVGYRLFSMRSAGQRTLRVACGLALALGAGVALTAVELLPFGEFLAESGTLASGGRSSLTSSDTLWYSPSAVEHLAAGITLVVPDFYGNPATHDYYWPLKQYQNYNEQTAYIGTLPLFLALAALRRPRRGHRAFFIALALFSLGVAWRLPLFEAVNHLPVFSIINNRRLRFVLAFALSVLAGWGADDLLGAERGDGTADAIARLTGRATVALLILAGAWYGFVHAVRLGVVSPGWPEPLTRWLLVVFSSQRARTFLPFVVAVLATLLLMYHARRHLRRPVLLVAVLLLAGGELVALGRGYCPSIPEEWLFPDTPALAFLRSQPQPTRVLAMENALLYNFGMVVGLEEIGGYDLPVSQRIANVYARLGGKDMHRQRWQPDWPVLELCGVQYVIGRSPLPPDRYELAYDGEVRIHRLRAALPRVFSVGRVEVVSAGEALERVLASRFDLASTALVEGAADTLATQHLSQAQTLEIVDYTPNRVSIRARFEGPGFVVLADAYDDDWRATVDGHSTTVYPTNYLLRGVAVPAGDHIVEFVYDPLAYRVGSIVSLTVLGGIVVAWAVDMAQSVQRERATDRTPPAHD